MREFSSNATAPCRSDCACANAVYKPICTPDDAMTFYSPCHAGCFAHNHNTSSNSAYTNCSCFALEVTRGVDGRCPGGWCPLFPLFGVGLVAVMFVTFTNNAPLLIASLRLVDAQHHTLALGVRQIFLRVLGIKSLISGIRTTTTCFASQIADLFIVRSLFCIFDLTTDLKLSFSWGQFSKEDFSWGVGVVSGNFFAGYFWEGYFRGVKE